MMLLLYITAAFLVPEILASPADNDNRIFNTRHTHPSTSNREDRELYGRQIAPSLQQLDSSDHCARCGIRGGGQAHGGQKIVNGTPAEPMEFPWRCALFIDYDVPEWSEICSCTILSPEWVLTAVHCTSGRRPEKMFVYAGAYDLRGHSGVEGYPTQSVFAAEAILHQDFNPWTLENDISLVRLKRPLHFAPNIQPICLPYKFLGRSFDWQVVAISGWGAESENGGVVNELRKLDMTLIPVDACREFYANSPNDSVIPEKQVCAYHLPAGGKSACGGDSGSSYDFLDPDFGRYYAVGVESYGRVPCGVALGPSLASRVTHFLNWIDYVTGTHFCG